MPDKQSLNIVIVIRHAICETAGRYIYVYICVCEWQPAARGHRAYTDLSAALSTGKGLTSKHGSYTPSGQCLEEPPLVDHSRFQEDLG